MRKKIVLSLQEDPSNQFLFLELSPKIIISLLQLMELMVEFKQLKDLGEGLYASPIVTLLCRITLTNRYS